MALLTDKVLRCRYHTISMGKYTSFANTSCLNIFCFPFFLLVPAGGGRLIQLQASYLTQRMVKKDFCDSDSSPLLIELEKKPRSGLMAIHIGASLK